MVCGSFGQLVKLSMIQKCARRKAIIGELAARENDFALTKPGLYPLPGVFGLILCPPRAAGADPVRSGLVKLRRMSTANANRPYDWYHAGQSHLPGSSPHDQRTQRAAIPAIVLTEQS
jgi:hypothetical protein